MAPRFVVTQTLCFVCTYMATRQYQFLLCGLVYQLLWTLWFSLGYTPVRAHQAIHVRLSAITWSLIYGLIGILISLRDNDLIESVVFYGIMALVVLSSMTTAIALSCHASCLGSEHWATNIIELCALVWTAAHDIRGDLIKSGIPLCIAAAIVRMTNGRNFKELIFWGTFIACEAFVNNYFYLYCTVGTLVFTVHLFIYGVKRGFFIWSAPFLFVYIFSIYLRNRCSYKLAHKDALTRSLVDTFDKLKYKQIM